MDNSFDLPPLPDAQYWSTQAAGVMLFTTDQMRAYALAAVQAERRKFAASALVSHAYEGSCPDELQPDARDPNCPACRALVALGIGEFT